MHPSDINRLNDIKSIDAALAVLLFHFMIDNIDLKLKQ